MLIMMLAIFILRQSRSNFKLRMFNLKLIYNFTHKHRLLFFRLLRHSSSSSTFSFTATATINFL